MTLYNKFMYKEVKLMSDDNNDIIKMNTNTTLTDTTGKPIQVNVPQPEYITETFNFHPNNSQILTGDDK